MTTSPYLSTVVTNSSTFYRITPKRFNTSRKSDHLKVVNGEGAVNSSKGFRYNHPGVLTVYLASDMETCFAEKMFYFVRDVVRALDILHFQHTPSPPSFNHHFVLWEIQFKVSIPDVFDLANHSSKYLVFPSMMTNPSQDYEHLKERRAVIQHDGYQGLIAPSSRSKNFGSLVVLFNNQAKNVASIQPFEVEVRLVNTSGSPFANHVAEVLDFGAGEVKVTGYKRGLYDTWTRIEFNH